MNRSDEEWQFVRGVAGGGGGREGGRHEMTGQHEVNDRTIVIGSQLVSGGRSGWEELERGGVCLVAT